MTRACAADRHINRGLTGGFCVTGKRPSTCHTTWSRDGFTDLGRPVTLYPSRLTESQRQVLASTATVLSPLAFYLAGGVALTLQLGHGQSGDLD